MTPKKAVIFLLLRFIFLVTVLVFLIRIIASIYQVSAKQKQPSIDPSPQVAIPKTIPLPIRLKIPKIGVDAAVEYVGVMPDGTMASPTNTLDVGWFNMGPRPGEAGSAVIAGHLNGQSGEVGVFADLHTLVQGDILYIQNTDGNYLTFAVLKSEVYNPGHADEVFGISGGTYLNLITCNGLWDQSKNDYSKRLVVFTQIVN